MSAKESFHPFMWGLLGGIVGGLIAINVPHFEVDIRIGKSGQEIYEFHDKDEPLNKGNDIGDLELVSADILRGDETLVDQPGNNGAGGFRVYTDGLNKGQVKMFEDIGSCLGLLDAGYYAHSKDAAGDPEKEALVDQKSMRKLYGELTQSYVAIRESLFSLGKTMDHPYWASRSVTKQAWSEAIDDVSKEPFGLNARGHGNAQALTYSDDLLDAGWFFTEVMKNRCIELSHKLKKRVATPETPV